MAQRYLFRPSFPAVLPWQSAGKAGDRAPPGTAASGSVFQHAYNSVVTSVIPSGSFAAVKAPKRKKHCAFAAPNCE